MVGNNVFLSNQTSIAYLENTESFSSPTGPSNGTATDKGRSIEQDLEEVLSIHSRCDTFINKSVFLGEDKFDTTDIVDHVLSNVGNNIPQDVRCALNIIIHASDIVDLVPGKNDINAFMQDVDKLRALISHSAKVLIDGAQTNAGDQEVRAYLSALMQDMENALTARHQYLSQLGPHQEISDIIGRMLEKAFSSLKLTPVNASDIKSIITNIDIQKNKMTSFMEKYSDFISGGTQYDVHKAVYDMDLRIQILNQLKEQNSLSEKEIFKAKVSAIEAAELVLHKVLKNKDGSTQTQSIILAALAFLEKRKTNMRERNNPETLSERMLAELNGGLKKFSGHDRNKLPAEIRSGIDSIVNDIYNNVYAGSLGEIDDATLIADNNSENQALLEKHSNTIPLYHPKIREEALMLAFLEKMLAAAGVTDADSKISFENLETPFILKTPQSILKIYQEARLDQRDQKGWKEIEKKVQLTQGATVYNFSSDIIPQAGLKIPFARNYAPAETENRGSQNDTYAHAFPDLIGDKGQNLGINSHRSTAYKHVTAFAYSQFKNEKGDVLFSGTRHGTLLPYSLSDKALQASPYEELEKIITDLLPQTHWEAGDDGALSTLSTALRIKTDKKYSSECVKIMREAAVFERAKDVIRSIIAADPKLLQAALDGEQVTVNVNQISLLTPDYVRRSLEFLGLLGANDNEYAMLQEQYNAWDKVSNAGNPIDLVLGGEGEGQLRISARVNINTFNFGVNEIAFMVPFANRLADERNARAMRALLGAHADNSQLEIGGQVGDWLRNNPGLDERKKQTVATLANQIAAIWQKGSYKSDGHEPYKMVSRLAVLTHMLGNKADFNCKSGKDRTGELDVEARYLAAQIAMTGEVPEPDVPRSLEERSNFFRMLVEGGNHEFQRYSAGIAGFKLYHLESLLSAIALDPANDGKGWHSEGESIRWFQGLSKIEGS